MSTRYALYLAPPPDSALWRFGSRVLGRDAATGTDVEGFAPPSVSPQAWREITAEPRRYGFHATLKAPFRLRASAVLADLEAACAALAQKTVAFDLGPLHLTMLKAGASDSAFLALTPAARSEPLVTLEGRALRDLDAFRASPTADEIARRRPDLLSERQRGHLATWGYPHVLEDFRLHFTLTGAVSDAEPLLAGLAEVYAREVSETRFVVDALVLFEQVEGAPFLVRRRFPLRARPGAVSATHR